MKKNILFVCTGNSCRSVMAEGLFRHLVKGREKSFLIGSAGTNALDGYEASEQAVQVMKKEGIDVSNHRSRRLTSAMVRSADKIFVMETRHREAILQAWPEASEKVHLLSSAEVPDPIGSSEYFYKNVFSVIREGVKNIVKEMEGS